LQTAWLAGKSHYLIPAGCKKWCAVALLGAREAKMNENNFRYYFTHCAHYPVQILCGNFLCLHFHHWIFSTKYILSAYLRVFLGQCQQRGMKMAEPMSVECIPRAKLQDVETLVTKFKEQGATFIHFVTADELQYHGHMKYIEVQEQILTQDLKLSTALAAPSKWQTLDNIVNKTNLKLGGLNYAVHLEMGCDAWLMMENRLVVGLDIAHPPVAFIRSKERSAIPSVVGYSANIKRHPSDFIGGYRYAKAEMEEICDDSVQQIFADLMQHFNTSRGIPPTHIFVIRDGVSEGQYKYVVNTEVAQVKMACQKVGGQNYRPHITYIVLTKMHSLRFYRKNIQQQGKAAEQNIKPGTIVDKHVVNPVLNEFYLNSHSAFQGTTKTPRYTLLYDTSKMSADEMQGVVHGLAFGFQIVNMAVSRPAPVMIASRMAQRGRSNYIAMYGDESENSDNGGGVEKDIAKLNNQLGYMSKELEDVRFNA
uniref:Piwi domain-containing protein n=1 Tax=Gongylonema pulchrum TaxID=637853 RepID=A0A183E5Y5_9BILA